MTLQAHFTQILEKYSLLNERFLLAVSGGIDSMALLHLFKTTQLHYEVAHVNYGFRGKESDRAAILLKQQCQSNKVNYHCLELDGYNSLTKANTNNLQEYARNERYLYFNKLCKERDLKYIVTAHHQDDQIETILLQLFRGTGIDGLSGIKECEKNRLRPLLAVTKTELVTFIQENNITYAEDSSNSSNVYKRNLLRNTLLPQVKEAFPNFEKGILNTISHLKEINSLANRQINKIIKRNSKGAVGSSGFQLLTNCITQHPQVNTLIWSIISQYEFKASQISEFHKLLTSKKGAYIENSSYKAIKNTNNITFILKSLYDSNYLIEFNKLEGTHLGYEFKIISHKNYQTKITQKSKDLFIDIDQINFPLRISSPKAGDFFYPLGLNKKKKIAQFLVNEKVTASDKATTLVLRSGQHIIAVLKHRIDHRFRIGDHTKQILHIKKREE